MEKLAVPLEIRLRKLLESFGPPSEGVSWYVSYTFRRPQLTKNWEPILRQRLRAFQSAEIQDTEPVIKIDNHFGVELLRKGAGPLCFVMAGHSDYNSGGCAAEELKKNLNVCIAEKTSKIAPYRSKYA